MAQFAYGRALMDGEIRLLKLACNDDVGELQGRLLVRRLDVTQQKLGQQDFLLSTPAEAAREAEDYEALSYTWGVGLPASKRIHIAVEDGQEHKPFNIRPNLEQALRLLSSRARPNDMHIWVDAICMNQNDKKEKSKQIPLMSKVYGRAKRVSVWLGETTASSDTAMHFVDQLLDLNSFDGLIEDTDRSDGWEAFCELLKNRWFGRRWIVQEIALAKKARIYCGSEEVDWDDFANAVSLVSSRPENIRRLFKKSPAHENNPSLLGDLEKLGACWLASTIENLFRKNPDGTVLERRFSLEALMSNLTLFEAGDPRDYLYSILWLATDVSRRGSPYTNHSIDHSRPNTEPTSPQEAGIDDVDLVSGNGLPDESYPRNHLRITPQLPSVVDPRPSSPKVGHRGLTTGPQTDTYQSAAVLDNIPSATPEKSTSLRKRKPTGSATSLVVVDARADKRCKTRQMTNSTQIPVERHPLAETLPPQSLTGTLPANGVDSSSRRHAYSSNLRVPRPLHEQFSDDGLDPDQVGNTKGISYTDQDLTISVDYNKPVYEVCKDFLSHVFSRLGYIDMMCRPWAPSPTEQHPWDPPSWMMTLKNRVAFELDEDRVYRRTGADPLVGAPQIKNFRSYNASGSKRAFEKMYTGKGSICYPPNIGPKANLFLRGFVLAEVTRTADPAADGNIPVGWLEYVDWDPMKATRGNDPPPEFWRTLVGDRGMDEVSEPPRHFRLACLWAFRRGAKRHSLKTSDILTHGKCPSHAAEFLRRMQRVVWNRRLVVGKCPKALTNDEDLLGLGPYDVRKGDQICILYGCSVPVILRKENAATLKEDKLSIRRKGESLDHERPTKNGYEVTDGEEWYKFVGECYVHGQMNGEAFSYMEERSDARTWRTEVEQEFEIR